jgi:hypothetical protein
MLRDCVRMAEFVHTGVESPFHLSVSVPPSAALLPSLPPLPSIPPLPLSAPARYYRRDDPLHLLSSWLQSFAVPHFPRERLFECCRDFLSTTLPSWTISCAPDASFSLPPPLASARPRSPPSPPPSLACKFSPSCVVAERMGAPVVLPFHRSCAFEWRDDSSWSVQCAALAYVPGQQCASWMLACTSATAVHSFVITGRVSLGTLSCYRTETLRSAAPAPSDAQSSFARYLLVVVPCGGGGSGGCSDASSKWLSDLKSITQIECLRGGYPNHDLSIPFSSPFVFQPQRRFGMGQQRSFSSAFGQGPNKRPNHGAS